MPAANTIRVNPFNQCYPRSKNYFNQQTNARKIFTKSKI
jgi:hypothetical protein